MRPHKSREFSLVDRRRKCQRDWKEDLDSVCPGWQKVMEWHARRNVDKILEAESGL